MMIDANDKYTQTLDLGEQPKRRGRPAKGQALSNAERQRLWRERQKAQRNEKSATGPSWEDARALMEKIDSVNEELEQARNRIKELEKQLMQRNEKTEKTYVCAIQKKSPKGQWRTVCKYENHIEGNIAYLEVGEGEMAHLYRIINLNRK